MKTKYNKRRYKLQAGVQYAVSDSPEEKPDYSEAYGKMGKASARNKTITDAGAQIAGPVYGAIAQQGSIAGDIVQSNISDKKAGSIAGGAIKMGSTGAAIGTMIMPGIGTAVGAGLGALAGGFMGASDYASQKKAAKKAEEEARLANLSKNIKAGSATDAQSFTAKKGKYKLRAGTSTFKQPRMIETEGREPIFSPKKADGTRDLLYYNPNDPTHEEGGVKAVVMPKRPASKYSLVGSGKMAYGAKQVKVNDLNNTAFSQNLTGMPSANVANKFVQPTTGIHQVARQVEENRRKEKIRTPRSHKKENPDTNRIIDPPMLYEMKPPPPRSTFNTKNDFNKGSKRVKVYR
jgi:hypothetical protein